MALVVVGKEGHVVPAAVEESLKPTAVKTTRWSPALKGGEPVEQASIVVPFVFRRKK